MQAVFATALLYIACVLFYQAHAKRSSFDALKNSVSLQWGVKIAAWCVALAALFVLARPQGWERGVPVWIALFMATGFASIFVGSLSSERHLQTGAVAFVGAAVSGLVMVTGGSL
ncbi:MAG: hypothetical protein AAFR27_11715 [Pseudomonadota bacterium]